MEPFQQESTVFRDMFSMPQGSQNMVEGLSDDKPIRLDGVAKNDFEQLLKALFRRQYGSVPGLPRSVDEWASVLKLSTKWEFKVLRQAAIDALIALRIGPVDRIVFAEQYDIKQWMTPALNELAKRLQPLGLEEGTRLGLETALKLASVRERVMVSGSSVYVAAARDARAQNLDFSPAISATFGVL
ncbi:hypothetical protein SCLCIDRAFT_1218881 [Scleroderma citrinum Foug A]|uniref:BTB domain-containing protein n=1 Tax=Scleroderma citrinum Foug A TaxID=1036808 RepID=A0A0C3DBS0_9AGAM|nr:hypothetical protein SCLCIDRAFT_1218881 [Scleroderma citrinum Foug A]